LSKLQEVNNYDSICLSHVFLSNISTTISNRCYSLENNEWGASDNMNTARVRAAAAQLQDGILLVTGGFNPDLNNAEISSNVGWDRNIPILPNAVYGHCMVTVNSTTVMVIGGAQNGPISGKIFYFTIGAIKWTEGPSLKYPRYYNTCGNIRRDKTSQEMSIIVAGSVDPSTMSSVEILDEGSTEWKTGPELPFGIWRPQMIEDQNKGVVLIGGGQTSSGSLLNTLYQLPNGGQDAVWTKMEQKMTIGRWSHTAIMVPDSIVDCY
jgi:hypothetical protein